MIILSLPPLLFNLRVKLLLGELGGPGGGAGGHDLGPEAESGDRGVGLELDGELGELAALHQEAAGQEGAAQPHAPVTLNLRKQSMKLNVTQKQQTSNKS